MFLVKWTILKRCFHGSQIEFFRTTNKILISRPQLFKIAKKSLWDRGYSFLHFDGLGPWTTCVDITVNFDKHSIVYTLHTEIKLRLVGNGQIL